MMMASRWVKGLSMRLKPVSCRAGRELPSSNYRAPSGVERCADLVLICAGGALRLQAGVGAPRCSASTLPGRR